MGADDPTSRSGGANSFAAQHSTPPRRALSVAPTDGSTKFNTIRIPLIPVACWRLEDPSFDFDSSFVSAKFRGEVVPTDPGQDTAENDGLSETSGPPDSPLTTLSGIVGQNQGCPAAIFGHCDPAGTDALNKTLGDRRAIAIYALLTRQPALWAYLYDNPQVGDKWDLRMVQAMLHRVPDANGQPYLADDPTGVRDSDTIDAVKRFQADSGLTSDGDPGSKTRKALFGAYMDWLCTPTVPAAASAAPSTQPARFTMQPTDFLGGVGAQAGDLPKMSLQSCGKFNPILLLTSDEMGGEDTTDGASKVQRNVDDAPKVTHMGAGAWSSGTQVLLNPAWLSLKIIDELYVFDGKSTSKPLVPHLAAWLNANGSRMLRLIGTANTEIECMTLARSLPSTNVSRWPPSLGHWYNDATYLAAHGGNEALGFRKTTDPVPPASAMDDATKITGIYLVNESPVAAGTDDQAAYKVSGVTLQWHGQQGQRVPHLGNVEAACLARYYYPTFLPTRKIETASDFTTVVTDLITSPDEGEKQTWVKHRHPWSVMGGTKTGDVFATYFEQCLKLSGF